MTALAPIDVAVIGCGTLAQGAHLPNLRAIEGARLAWACDASASTLRAVASAFRPQRTTRDYMDVIRDPATRAIILATAQDVRLPVIRAAAAAGKAIYCEKPIASTLRAMNAIRKVVTKAGVVFCAGHNRRSAPAMQYAREAFRAARAKTRKPSWRLDRISGLRAPWPEERQATMLIRINDDLLSWKPWVLEKGIVSLGPMMFEMTHFTDLACWFLERQPVEVNACGHLRANQSVSILFDDGSLATIFMTGVGTFSYPKELYELYVNGSAVVVDHLMEVRTGDVPGFPIRRTFPFGFKQDPHPRVDDGGGIRAWHVKRRHAEKLAERGSRDWDFLTRHEGGPNKGHQEHLRGFLDAARGLGPSPCDADSAILATRIALAAIESLRKGRPVRMG